ncbi:MAG: hypothetical protein IJJ33_02080 [Victivallales bacterium]|nr:hypothetical protein [Victivallales bacterium]
MQTEMLHSTAKGQGVPKDGCQAHGVRRSGAPGMWSMPPRGRAPDVARARAGGCARGFGASPAP